MNAEPEITINGQRLSEGQALTLRVALQNFLSDLREPNALGSDLLGQQIAQNYRNRGGEINRIMSSVPGSEDGRGEKK